MDKYRRRVGGGLSFFFFVLIFGLILAAFNTSVGLGFSLRIPSTDFNISVGGSLGKKETVPQVLPGYLRSRIADNSTFFNHSNVLTIWLAEGMFVAVLGNQPEASLADLSLNLSH